MHVGGERPRVAKQQHERREAEQRAEHTRAPRQARVADEQIQDDENQQQRLDLGDAAREPAQLLLLDLETALDRVAAHGAPRSSSADNGTSVTPLAARAGSSRSSSASVVAYG